MLNWEPSEQDTLGVEVSRRSSIIRYENLLSHLFKFQLNNRVLLSKALSCDRVPEEI